jgi:hypothetical protein
MGVYTQVVSRTRRVFALCSVALLLFAVASAFGARRGLYRGSVVGDSAHHNMQVRVKNGRVTQFLAEVNADCYTIGSLFVSVVYPPVGARSGSSIRIRRNGKFSATFVGNPAVPDDIRTITGRFRGSSVAGTIRVVGPCTADARYRARR